MEQLSKTGIEIWGGIECSINKVNNSYFDQLDYAGHYHRGEDIDAFAALGIKKMRYPILWEKHQPVENADIDWLPTEEKLKALREKGIDVIAGLVHHGSGPAYVNMADDSFGNGLAAYAGKVAEKFPWIQYYTPVNEPLTTARFCGLYGIWHPHHKSAEGFCRILINECKATVLAMQAIRQINADAALIQTEDLGKTHSTPLLQYQADFENERRWLTFDLLTGRVDSKHPLWDYLIKSGISPNELEFFHENTCTPAVMGFNHYLTSERYLDENTDNFPDHTRGGNSIHRYCDVEAVRVGHVRPDGPYNLLKQAWERYQLPLAVTEVHLYCTREEQMRWLKHAWQAANELKNEGVDVRAITPWALLGSFGWDRLLTGPRGDYEPGVFTLTADQPRATALAGMIKAYSYNGAYHHPVINNNGWWQRSCRVIYGTEQYFKVNDKKDDMQPLLIVGRNGTLARAFARLCELRGIAFRLFGHDEMDVKNATRIDEVITELNPWAVVNTSGFVRVDDAEWQAARCFAVNTFGAANLAVICARHNVKLVTFSTDLVFDGVKTAPYTERDEKSPLNVYGQSKALAEEQVLKYNPDALVIRTSAFFSPWDEYNFITLALNSLRNGLKFKAAKDVYISPTYVPDLVNATLDMLIDDESGIWHLSNKGRISWAQLAYTAAELRGLKTSLVVPKPLVHFDYKAKRPLYSVLESERGNMLPDLDDAMARYIMQVDEQRCA